MSTSGVLAYRATYVLFILALPLYIWYRWTHTVAWDAESPALSAYQAAVALVELFGGVSVLLLGAVRFPRPWAPANPQPPQTEPVDASDPESIRGFQVSILIPCYSEPDEIILGAVRAALGLRHPLASRVTVYLLDDGGRPERAAAVRALGAQYVSRPKDPSKPRHGKAGNLNYFFRGVLCGGARPLCEGGVPGPEHVVAVFDCDMEAHADFLGHTLPYLAAEPRVALVQTPQAFFNVAPAADIFNHNNVGFFQAVQPGLDAWGATVCCGTNFAVRAAALHEVGWFPTESITEDFLLSLKLAAAGHVCRYHAAVVSTGEAPEDLRQIFKQRERWCTGCFQVFFHREMWATLARLRWPQKLCFLNAPVGYVCSIVTLPVWLLVPALSLYDVHPVRALTPELVLLWCATYALMVAVCEAMPRRLNAAYCGFVASKANAAFWWCYAAALGAALVGLACPHRKATFQVTEKRSVAVAAAAAAAKAEAEAEEEEDEAPARDSSLRDVVYHHVVVSGALLVMAGGALHRAAGGDRHRWERPALVVISAAWLCINALPAAMVLAYAHGPHSFEAHAAVVRGAWWGHAALTLTIACALLLAAAHERRACELVDCAAV